jgi:transcription elongation factor GreA
MEDWDKVIFYLKKILDHEPTSAKARTDLIRVYKQKYASHSLLEDFMKMSELGNTKKPVKVCITNFERNIVFDTGNYVLHRNWGVGKITSISKSGDSIHVDFKDKKDHKLSIQMAITSLKPLKKDHIWVRYYENRESILDLFNQDIGSFMTDLLKSFENVMSVADVKSEIVGEFIKADEWSKWWNKVKIALKKDPNIGMNPKKKDEIILHEKPITLSEELIMKFNAQSDYNKKLDIALDSLKDPDEAFEALESFNHFYNDEEQVKDPLRKILAYLFLEESSKTLGKEEVQRNLKPGDISQLIQNMKKEECLEFSKSLQNVEVKKGYVNLIKKYHPQAFDIMMGMLFEVPVKINKHVFQILNSEEKYSELNLFLETVLQKSKDHPEVFLWVAKSVLSDAWDHAWLKISKEDLLLRVFRILKPLGRIEEKGNRLKKIAQELILDEEAKILKETLSKVDTEFCRKLYALYREVPYIEDIKKDQFRDLLSSIRTDLIWEEEAEDTEEDDVYIPEDGILVTRQAFNHKKSEFDHLVNVEMLENSRDIGEAQEKGDLRENAEYKAAMEKQVQLQAQIKKIEAELKSARILDLSEVKTDRINIGCSVVLKNDQSNDKVTFSILGAWDANTEKNIISYQSPLAKSLLGKRVGESVSLVLDESASKYVIQSIARFSFVGQEA